MKVIGLAIFVLLACNACCGDNSILQLLKAKIYRPEGNSTVFWPVSSLAEEDEKGLPGLQYDPTMPDPPAKNFTGRRIGFVVEILAPWWVPGQVVSCEFVRAKMWAARTRNFKEAWDVEYDAIVVPGGVWSSTVVRNDGDAITLIQGQYKQGKLLATTCSGSTVLINAGLAKGKSLTGSPSIAIDLVNAGADYKDVPTVTAGNLVSGRSPGGKDSQLWITAMADYLSTH